MAKLSQNEIASYAQQSVTKLGGGSAMAQFITQCALVESGGKTHVKAGSSSAGGLLQFIDDSWSRYGSGSRFDPQAACDAGVRMAQDNARVMRPLLGREPSAGEFYLAHFAGIGGVQKILKADLDAPISTVMTTGAIKANDGTDKRPGVTFNGKRFRDFTVRDLRAWADHKMTGQLSARDRYADWSVNDSGIAGDDDASERDRRTKYLQDIFGVSSPAAQLIGQLFFAFIEMLTQQGNAQRFDKPVQNAPVHVADGSTVTPPSSPAKAAPAKTSELA